MGNGTSISSATHDTAIKRTINVRSLCNDILRFMLERVGVNDFYKLASRSECSKYVIFLANKLDTTFRGLSFAPARGAAGKLYFQPIDKLKAPSPKEKAERESLCLFLAYFYVRIFQIYGAIHLTLTDDANTYVKIDAGQFLDIKYKDSDRSRDVYGPPGAPDPYPKPGFAGLFTPASKETFGPINPPRRSYNTDTRRNNRYDSDRDRDRDRERYGRERLTGGADRIEDKKKLGEFQLLDEFLVDQQPESLRIMEDEETNYKFDKDDTFLIDRRKAGFSGVFTIIKVKDFAAEEKPSNGKLIFPTDTDRAKTKIYVINVAIKKGGRGRPEGNYFKIMRVDHKSLLDQINRKYARERYSTDRLIDIPEGGLERVFYDEFGVRDSEFPIAQLSKETFQIRTSRGDISVKDFLTGIKTIIEDKLGFRSRRRNETRRNTALGTLSLDNNIQAVLGLEPMKIIRENPPANRPLNLCSARALQLLGNKQGDKFETAVCNQGFLWQQKDGKAESRKSLIPDYDKSLEDSVGFPLLSALFSDDSRFREFKIMKSKTAIKEYIDFLIRITKQYSPDETNRIKEYSDFLADSTMPLAQKQLVVESSNYKLKGISDTKMKGVCSGSNNKEKLKTPIELKSVKGTAVQQKVGQLYGRQIAHANRCEQILKQLFTVRMVDGVKSITLNKNIFIRGINEVNRINQLTRQTLVKYYEDCERLYREGVDILMKEDKKPVSKAVEKADEEGEENDSKPAKPTAAPAAPAVPLARSMTPTKPT